MDAGGERPGSHDFHPSSPMAHSSPLSIPPVPVDADVVGGSAAGDDVGTAVAVEVGGHAVLAPHAAILDDVSVEGQGSRARARAWLGIINQDTGALRLAIRVGALVALADDQLVVAVAVEVGAPDGV